VVTTYDSFHEETYDNYTFLKTQKIDSADSNNVLSHQPFKIVSLYK
jgi:hypothetical protein